MKTTKKKASKAKPRASNNDFSIVPPLAAEMRGFYQQHGFYRAQDVQRVLGDPRDSLEVNVMSGLVFSRTVK